MSILLRFGVLLGLFGPLWGSFWGRRGARGPLRVLDQFQDAQKMPKRSFCMPIWVPKKRLFSEKGVGGKTKNHPKNALFLGGEKVTKKLGF